VTTVRVTKLISELQDGPKTVYFLADITGMCTATVRTWLRAFHKQGLVENLGPTGPRMTNASISRPEVWVWK
jgi:DNA-binding IclR family transcriptional regulator